MRSDLQRQADSGEPVDLRPARETLLQLFRKGELGSPEALISASQPFDAIRSQILSRLGLTDASGQPRHPDFRLACGSPPSASRLLFSDYDFTSECRRLNPARFDTPERRHYLNSGYRPEQLRHLQAFFQELSLIKQIRNQGYQPDVTPLRITVPALDLVVWRDIYGRQLARPNLNLQELLTLQALDEEFAPPPNLIVRQVLDPSSTVLFEVIGHLGKVIRYIGQENGVTEALEQHAQTQVQENTQRQQSLLDLQVLINKIGYKLLDIRKNDPVIQKAYRRFYPAMKAKAKMKELTLPKGTPAQQVKALQKTLQRDALRLRRLIQDVFQRTFEECVAAFQQGPDPTLPNAFRRKRIELLEYMANYLALLDSIYDQGLSQLLGNRPATGSADDGLGRPALSPRSRQQQKVKVTGQKLIQTLRQTAQQLREQGEASLAATPKSSHPAPWTEPLRLDESA